MNREPATPPRADAARPVQAEYVAFIAYADTAGLTHCVDVPVYVEEPPRD